MSDLLDFFADWAKQKRRWPLLLLLAIPAIFKLLESYLGTPFRATLRHPAFLLSSFSIVLLSLGLYFFLAYSERVRYSRLVDRIRRRFGAKAVRLLVSDEVAWHVLSEKSTDGTSTSTVAAMLAELASEIQGRVVVMKASAIKDHTVEETDGLVVGGKSQSMSLLLNASMVITEARSIRMVKEISEAMTLPESEDENLVLILPPSRFLRSRFLFSHFSPEAPLRVDVYGENRMAAARMVLRCALATMLSYDDSPLAGKFFREVISDAKLLPGMQSQPLANLAKTSAYYFALRERDLDRAIEALGLAHQFAGSDPLIEIVRAYLLLSKGKRGEAGAIIEHITADPDSAATLWQLKGEFLRNTDRPKESIEAYQEALKLITDMEDAPNIHLAVALVYGMSDHVSRHERSDQMIAHLEDAIAREPETAVFHILKGFAWAMQGSADLSERAFAQGDDLCGPDGDRSLLEYWRSRAGFELGKYEETVKELEQRLGDLDKVQDTPTLLVLSQNLMNIDGREAEAEKYLDRILAAGNAEGKVFRYKGLALVARLHQEEVDDPEQRLRLLDDARKYLLKSTRTDDERATTHTLLARLYLADDDRVNAKKHAKRAAELDPLDPNPLLTLANVAINSGLYDEAFAMLAKARALLPDDVDLELTEGLARQKAGQLELARVAYRKATRLDPESEAGHSNLAFVLFDLNQIDEALTHWNVALEINPESADSVAGRAIGLAEKGQAEAALEAYRTATAKDPAFLDIARMKKEYLWSAGAAQAAQLLIDKIHSAPLGQAVGE